MFKGCTFDNQNVTSKNDGGLYGAIFTGNGILWGCSMSVTTDTLTIQPGEMVVGGRLIWVDGATQIPFTGPIADGYGQVILTIDLSKTATIDEFEQVEASVVYSTTTTFPALTQGQINSENGDMIYQQELAVVSIAGSNITAITRKLGDAEIDAEKLGGKLPGEYARLASSPVFTGTVRSNGYVMAINGLYIIDAGGNTLSDIRNVENVMYITNSTGGIIMRTKSTGTNNIALTATGKVTAQDFLSGWIPIEASRFDAGNECYITRSGTVMIINANGASQAQFRCNNGVAFYNNASSALVAISASNVTGSSERYKENIREMTDEEANKILEAVAVAFDWKKDSGYSGASYSFIAERMAEIDERFVYKNADGKVEGILANPIMAAQNHVIKRHETEINELKSENAALKALLVSKGVCTQEEIENL